MTRWSRAAAGIAVVSSLVVAGGVVTAGVRGWSVSSPAPTIRHAPPSFAASVEATLSRRMSAFPAGWEPTEPLYTISLTKVSHEFVGHYALPLSSSGFVGGVGKTFVVGPHNMGVNVELWRFGSAVGAQSFASSDSFFTSPHRGHIWAREFVYPSASNGRGYLGRGVDKQGHYFSVAFDARGAVFVQTRCFSSSPVNRAMVERYERIALRATSSAS